MRILLLNPNTTASLTERMAAVAGATGTAATLVPVTAPRGFAYISSRAEADLAAAVVLELIAEHQDADAVVIAAYGDPGLTAARELFDMPVTGMAEAAMLTACALGERFAVVTFAARLTPWFQNGVERAGLSARFAGLFVPDEGFGAIDNVQEELAEPLAAACHRAADAGADSVILAGAPLAGLAGTLGPQLPVPAVDPVSAAVLQAEALVRLKVRKATRGAFARPPAKESTGLSRALAARIGHQNG